MGFIIFIIGLTGLIWSSDRLIPELERAGARFGVPMAMMAFLVLAVGTSLPELVASIFAAATGELEIAISNLFGSNIANSLLIGGAIGLIATGVTVSKDVVRQTWLMLAVALISTGAIAIHLSHAWLSAIVVMMLTAAVVLISYRQARKSGEDMVRTTTPVRKMLLVILGLFALLVISGAMTVYGVEAVATYFNLSDVAAGAVLLAIGTSLPELVAGIAALRRKQGEAAIATVVGSNIINLSVLLAITLLVGYGQELSSGSFILACLSCVAVLYFTAALLVKPLHGKLFKPWAALALAGFAASVYINS